MTAVKKKAKKPARRNYSKQCDELFSKLVRSVGVCEIDDGRPCSGVLQCAHGFSRRYHAVRWDRRNAFSACQGHHFYYTNNPLQWDDFLHKTWGTVQYLRMRNLAVTGTKPDTKALLLELRSQWKAAA